jgi:thymidylate synthase
MNVPVLVERRSFQEAWIKAAQQIKNNGWELWNLVVQIREPHGFDDGLHHKVAGFAAANGLLGPKDVAYTIFPHRLYQRKENAERLIAAYNERLFPRVMARSQGTWGTYFRRMVHYGSAPGVNQLQRVIQAIRTRERTMRAAYTIVIEEPGSETVKPRGAPCLNHIVVQLNPGSPRTLGLLCTYRNHDFLERAYGNYWGLCNLLCFLARETGSSPGPLTCVSSHAYVDGKKTDLSYFLGSLL